MPLFEHETPETILERILSRMDTDLQTREGSYAYDQAAPIAFEIWRAMMTLDELIEAFYVNENSGKYLDAHGDIFNLARKSGSRAQAEIAFSGRDGLTIPAGTAFFTGYGLEFDLLENVTIKDGEGTGVLRAAEVGAQYNVPAGDVCQMLRTILGLASFAVGEAEGGTDPESDEALFRRIDDRRKHPPASGNPSYYRELALEVEGVGDAKVERLWAGPGTCRVLLVGHDRGPVEQQVVDAVAAHIGPRRIVGAEVTVASVIGTEINVAVHLVLDKSTTRVQAKEALASALGAYLRELAFEEYVVYINEVGARIMAIDGVVDYSGLTLNGGTENIAIAADAVPVPGEVAVT